MRKVLAVSGGVDSMVMLTMFARQFPVEELVVATFDHGTRESSKRDAEFVSEVASALKIEVFQGSARLGAGVSEERARRFRYDFLRKAAFTTKGEIYTAHHLDDLVETVAINFLRGTGFRGLAPLSSPGIRRPFLEGILRKEGEARSESRAGEAEEQELIFDKNDILRYAAREGVVFREDPTNSSEDYLRNRVRERTRELSRAEKMKVFELFLRQKKVVGEIEEILEAILPEDLQFFREDFREMPEEVGAEVLRGGLARAGIAVTRPQLADFLAAVRDYAPGKKFNLPEDRLVKLNKNDFKILC